MRVKLEAEIELVGCSYNKTTIEVVALHLLGLIFKVNQIKAKGIREIPEKANSHVCQTKATKRVLGILNRKVPG